MMTMMNKTHRKVATMNVVDNTDTIPEITLKTYTIEIEPKIIKLDPLPPHEINWCLLKFTNLEESSRKLRADFEEKFDPDLHISDISNIIYIDFVYKTFSVMSKMDSWAMITGRHCYMTEEEAISHFHTYRGTFTGELFNI
jgi:hypothetical protein